VLFACPGYRHLLAGGELLLDLDRRLMSNASSSSDIGTCAIATPASEKP
jgi:hypothetical protein